MQSWNASAEYNVEIYTISWENDHCFICNIVCCKQDAETGKNRVKTDKSDGQLGSEIL